MSVKEVKAYELEPGDIFTYEVHTYTATNVKVNADQSVTVYTEGFAFGMDFYLDSMVQVHDVKPAKPVYKKGQTIKTRGGLTAKIVCYKGYSKYLGRSYIAEDVDGNLWTVKEIQFVR